MQDRNPEPIAERIKCDIWMNCVYGAGCILSSFNSESKQRMPLLIIEDGVPVCQDVKRG